MHLVEQNIENIFYISLKHKLYYYRKKFELAGPETKNFQENPFFIVVYIQNVGCVYTDVGLYFVLVKFCLFLLA